MTNFNHPDRTGALTYLSFVICHSYDSAAFR